MAKYNIIDVDFVSSGSKRGMLRMKFNLGYSAFKTVQLLRTSDTEENPKHGVITESGRYEYHNTDYFVSHLSNGEQSISLPEDNTKLLLKEQQSVIELTSLSGSYNYDGTDDDEKAQLNPPSIIQISKIEDVVYDYDISDVTEFDNNHKSIEGIYEFEKIHHDNMKAVVSETRTSQFINPLNDIKDVMVKSMYKKGLNSNSIAVNPNAPKNIGQDVKQSSENRNVDIYMDFKNYPIGFCNYKNYTWMITDKATRSPYVLSTDIVDLIESSDILTNYSYKLTNDSIKTSLYGSHEDYNVSSYQQHFLTDESNMDNLNLIDFFSRKRQIDGIWYHYIMNIDQTGEQYLDNPTVYDDGNIPGSQYIAKNMYNSLYTMEMPHKDELLNCRQYTGVQSSNRGIVLKFHDNINYNVSDNNAKLSSTSNYPYQKMELFIPVKSNNQTTHKSSLFSIKIRNTGLNSEEQNMRGIISKKIMADINNNIREFVSNICPANTQLFDVYYTE